MMKKKRTRVGRAKERAANKARDNFLIPFVKRKFKETIEDDSDFEKIPENDDDLNRYIKMQELKALSKDKEGKKKLKKKDLKALKEFELEE